MTFHAGLFLCFSNSRKNIFDINYIQPQIFTSVEFFGLSTSPTIYQQKFPYVKIFYIENERDNAEF